MDKNENELSNLRLQKQFENLLMGEIIKGEQYLYHVTRKEHLENILEQGLIPNIIEGYYGTNETKIICLTIQSFVNAQIDQERDTVLKIDLLGVNPEKFVFDFTHEVNIEVDNHKPKADELKRILYEYGIIAYAERINPDFLIHDINF